MNDSPSQIETLALVREYAFSFVGREYIYGGNGPYFDCSGFVIELLKVGGYFPLPDMTAADLFKHFSPRWSGYRGIGALAFYGSPIIHVAWCLDEKRIIECGGGDHTTTSIEEARKRNAFVRIRGVEARHDLSETLGIAY